jgi:hypothetical protein
MSNKELKDANERMRLENEHKDLIRKGTVGKKIVTTIVTTGATILSLKIAQQNFKLAGESIKKLNDLTGNPGRKAYDRVIDKVGDFVIKDLNKGLKKPLA